MRRRDQRREAIGDDVRRSWCAETDPASLCRRSPCHGDEGKVCFRFVQRTGQHVLRIGAQCIADTPGRRAGGEESGTAGLLHDDLLPPEAARVVGVVIRGRLAATVRHGGGEEDLQPHGLQPALAVEVADRMVIDRERQALPAQVEPQPSG